MNVKKKSNNEEPDPNFTKSQSQAPSPNASKELAERLVERLAESQKKILALVQTKPNISKKDLAAAVGISSTAIDKNISTLKAKGLLKRVGPDNGGYWVLVEAARGKGQAVSGKSEE